MRKSRSISIDPVLESKIKAIAEKNDLSFSRILEKTLRAGLKNELYIKMYGST